jgi:hypothetical protein
LLAPHSQEFAHSWDVFATRNSRILTHRFHCILLLMICNKLEFHGWGREKIAITFFKPSVQ